MASWVTAFLDSAVGRWCGVPQATLLQRPDGENQYFTGSLLLCGKASDYSVLLRQQLSDLAAVSLEDKAQPLQALIFDATQLQSTSELDMLWQQLTPLLPRLTKNGRLIVLARAIDDVSSADAAAAAAALSGFTLSLIHI